ncbi:hypothetical protein MSSAC_0345 [Methanosarcina siciliae C2J]|uniref:Zinc-binding protein n=3 Tax=Methanosarcina siciliae TaxID=38027 RepID=A0A0E3PAC2_9EURY|nr:putative zinc-binding protein [Methanosarcina siciliae]AKB27027.1 hypothetical protein MSSIT_0308 [Methanosarcina siciliae T4/M]AKB30992.1 hypothetical protein MSSIH_0302 [Methanosarcina siciliae HI350]AKB34935.1 hypothetical protein MSSAC_0345 [Methanosarcina siciliae C2J]
MPESKSSSSDGTVLIFPCAGATNLGQLSTRLGIEMENRGLGTFKCTSGIGSQRSDFLIAAARCDKIIAIDGCDFNCSMKMLRRAGFEADRHIILTRELGMKLNRELNVPDTLLSESIEKLADKL